MSETLEEVQAERDSLREQLEVSNTLIIQLQASLAAEQAEKTELEKQLRSNPVIQKRMLEDLKELDRIIDEKQIHRDNIPVELSDEEREAVRAVRQADIDKLIESRNIKAEYITTK